MKTIALFNNKGGVGKTSLIYHLAWMFSELGVKVVAADLDPQCNLTSMCLSDQQLDKLYSSPQRETVATSINPIKDGLGDVQFFAPRPISDNFALITGDLSLSDFEDELSTLWPQCLEGKSRAFRVTCAFDRLVQRAAQDWGAELALIDVGPNFGAINRAALISADVVVIPVAPDLFSVQGLRNVGGRLKTWRRDWADRRERKPELDFTPPTGRMRPIGYVVSRHTKFAEGVVRAYQNWIDKIPQLYRDAVDDDPLYDPRLSQLKDYRSLIALAQEARKPMFLLKPGDGAIGGHQSAVSAAYDDFEHLARTLVKSVDAKLGMEASEPVLKALIA